MLVNSLKEKKKKKIEFGKLAILYICKAPATDICGTSEHRYILTIYR